MTYQKRFITFITLPLMVTGIVGVASGLAWHDWHTILLGTYFLAVWSGARWSMLAAGCTMGWRRVTLIGYMLCVIIAGIILFIVQPLEHWQW
jgi:hypothetical protein